MDDRRTDAIATQERDQDGAVRRATILDVPAMVRALAPIEAPEGVSDSEMSRILRLTLTHVAIEHGLAWIELDQDGGVVGTALAVPTWELDGSRELPDLLAREAAIEAEPVADQDPQLGWVGAIGRAWLVAHPVCGQNRESDSLVRHVVDEAEAAARIDQVPIVLIATRPQDRELGRRLGFATLDVTQAGEALWIGAKGTETVGPRPLSV